ncbi:ATP-dependent DNA helicase Q4 isoform X2 [Toxorhynchites rutilus septentrionalis]|uniref:ATP-dependent DNA helicase Q4 isoform X2 n=1 Tax=Toxorhynchites rutilus septentrionalis TaxID=329112 RepID=UPI00247A4EE2|nr:ATP-dependent DNA helicase Q4 isoform X2 [Toxorhynchites rutilus septentrionalis]
MEDPVFRTKYKKCKRKVRLWEKEFLERCGRIPSKHDIRDSPTDVRQSYKMYYKLKTVIVENALQNVLDDDDDFDSSLVSQMESSLNQESSLAEGFSNINELRSSNVSINNLLTDQVAGNVSEFEAEQELDQNINAWGRELNRNKVSTVATPPVSVARPKARAPSKLSMDASGLVPKRNPRKSLSSRLRNDSRQSDVTGQCSSAVVEALPDLETLLNEKSKQALENSPPKALKLDQMPRTNFNELDQGWLNRQATENGVVVNVPVASASSFGMSGLRINSFCASGGLETNKGSHITAQSTAFDQSVHLDSDGVVENSEDEASTSGSFGSHSVRHVVKKRKVCTSINALNEKNSGTGAIETKLNTSEKKENLDPAKINEPIKIEPKAKQVRKKVTTKPKIERKDKIQKGPVIRRISARIRKTASYSNTDTVEDGDKDSFEEFDDEDKDPCFVEDKNKRVPQDALDETFEEIIQEPSPVKTKDKKAKSIPKTRTKKVHTSPSKGKRRSGNGKKSPVAPRIGGNTGKGKKKAASVKRVSLEGEAKVEDDFNEYVLEFGIENLNNAPRIDIAELQENTQMVENFIQNIPMRPATAVKSDEVEVVTSKEAVLRKKVAAGKLNENFVRVDLRKKVFVRGKKTINFSKYKKSLWKKKKIAALSGPDMDMGGCDGGLLVCFQCGGVGHMARSCKVKGEQLLPLDAVDQEESPFPTLEESESMAKAKAVLVHANKIHSLPAVNNPTWKKDDDELTHSEKKSLEQLDLGDEWEDETLEPEPAPVKTYIGHAIPQDFLKESGILEYTVGNKDKNEPLYQLQSDGTLPPTPKEVFEALQMFGHKQFRAGQERAVMRVLCGLSTLVTLSTGSGKSLCYQLPAYLFRKHRKCVTLVISPLVSLMEDQVHGVPSFLNAQCLHTNQTPKVRERTMAAITAGELDVLLISPEAVVSGEKSTGFGSLLRQLPPIAFACIDEAHCVSQWSHNFRPSYLMICRVLKEKLGVNTILGLTATATLPTRQSIIEHLSVPDGLRGIISDIPLPDNLILTVSRDANRDAALLHLLQSERFEALRSIIVYCTRRDECERLAAFLRTCFQKEAENATDHGSESKKRKRMNYVAEPYHAGLSASRRRTIQNAFMSGDLKVVVATIAFGMGINKSDIRAIIHYNMPKSFESYVQEVGRAGRDGETSHCHLFLDNSGNDRNELRRHIYANSIDRHVIRKLLQKIYVPCGCVKNFRNEEFSEEYRKRMDVGKNNSRSEELSVSKPTPKKRICPGHEVCFSIQNTVQELDIPEENISTLLCYLELHQERYIQVLSRAYVMCKVMSYAGPKAMRNAAKECPPLAMAIALDLKKNISHDNSTFIEFPVIDVAAAIGWDSGVVKFQLKNMEWTTERNTRKRSPISVSFFDLGFRIRAPGDLTDDELEKNLDSLYERVKRQEKTQLGQLQTVFDALSSVAFPTFLPVSKADCPHGASNKLKTIIREYFQSEVTSDYPIIAEPDDTPDTQLLGDIRTLIHRYPENNFSGRAIARIFHGVQSPNYPAVIWGRCNFWRTHTRVDFNRIVQMANTEIVRLRT